VIQSAFTRITLSLSILIYSILIIWGLYFGSHSRQHLNEFKYNLYPFKTIFTYIVEYDSHNKTPFVINIIGNIVVFIPFGFIGPILFQNKLNRLDKLLFASVIGILLIEIPQLLLKVGVFDIDDIILNLIGVLIGFSVLKLIEP
jgi:glycopeptide antibiotics resistance protein